MMRGHSAVDISPIAREAFEDIHERTLPAGARIEMPAITADLALVDPRMAGRTGRVVGDSTEVLWASMGWPFLVAEHVLHQVLLDGDTEPITVSDLSMVRNDRAALSATERVSRLPFALGGPATRPRREADPVTRDVYNEIMARRWSPGRRFAVLSGDVSRSLRVREGVVLPGPVQVRWSARGGGYELPEAVLHRVRFDDAAAPEWVSDHRMAGVQDSRAERAAGVSVR